MRLQLAILEDRHLRLEPLADVHAPDLRAACAADRTIWYELYPTCWLGEGFDANWRALVQQNAEGAAQSFAVVVGGRCVGMTSFLGPDAVNGSVEIGATYYRPEVRGGAVNPAAKRLLLAHAFEAGARRVQLKVDLLNTRSQAAVAKLGAAREGVLRQDRVTWTGRVRDTVYFSILSAEWPGVRARLDARLAAYP